MNEERKDWPVLAYGFLSWSGRAEDRNLGCLIAFLVSYSPLDIVCITGFNVYPHSVFVLRVILTMGSDYFLTIYLSFILMEENDF
jgi:hypothetical protein